MSDEQRRRVFIEHLQAAISALDMRNAYRGPMAPDRAILTTLVEYLSGDSSASETPVHLGWAEEERKCLLNYHDFHGRQMPDPMGAAHRARAEQIRGAQETEPPRRHYTVTKEEQDDLDRIAAAENGRAEP